MLRFLRTRLQQGVQTTSFPTEEPTFPPRFRGRPMLRPAEGGIQCTECVLQVPSSLLVQVDREPALDVGACLFCPEEARACAHGTTVFTPDYRMATRSRDALVSPDGELDLAQALDAQARKLFGRSLRLRSVAAGSCNGCEAELVALGNVVFDMARFGVQFVASPRHADGIVVTGAVSRNMKEAVLQTLEAVPQPRLVIAVGACAINGGPFRGSPEVEDGVSALLPVDLWIPGCPPHPLTTLDGLLRLLGRVEAGVRPTPAARQAGADP